MLDEFRSTYITWDKATRRIYSPITANGSDSNGRKLNIQVVNSGQVENLTGAALHLYWETKDKTQHGLDAFTASDISKGEFELFYTTGMLSNVGELNATLVLVDSTGKVVSDWFKITVTRGINEDAVESENSFSSLTQALIDISNLEQNYAPRLSDLTAQLQQTVQVVPKNVYDFGATGDREVDESTFIQAAINAAVSAGFKKLIFPKKTYRIENPVYFDKNDLNVDFQNSTFEWYGEGTIIGNIWGEMGVFNIMGNWDYSDRTPISYIRSLGGTNHLPPSTAPILLTLESQNKYSSFYYEGGSRISTSNNSHFSVGDDILLMGWTRPEYRPYDVAKFEPELRKVVKVTKVDADYVYIDYDAPFDYPSFINNQLVKSVALKVNLTRNVTLENFEIRDMILRPGGSSGSTADTPSGTSILLADNIEIKNYTMEQHRFSALFVQYSRNIKHKGIKARNAQWWSGGEGYLMQLIGSRGITNEDILGEACRHVIDVSWSSDVQTYNAEGVSSKSTDFTHHGCTEHDIYWFKVKGSMNFNHGIEYFPEIVVNATVEDSAIGLSASSTGFAENITFENSFIKSYGFRSLNTAKYSNSLLEVYRTTSPYLINKRGTALESRASLTNCTVKIAKDSDDRLIQGFHGIDHVVLENVTITTPNDVFITDPQYIGFVFKNFKSIKAHKVHLNNTIFLITQDKYTSCSVMFADLTGHFTTKQNSELLRVQNINNVNLSIFLSNSVLNYYLTEAAGRFRLYRFENTVTNSTIILNLSDNHILGDSPETIDTLDDSVGSNIYMQDHDNVIKNKRINSAFSDKNIFI